MSADPQARQTARRYRTIVADPPWTPDESTRANYTDRKAYPQKHYTTMTLRDICAIKPPAQESSHLWLWSLTRHVDWGYTVARAWGFEPLTIVTSWCKPSLGAGRFQCNTEHVLLCRRGRRDQAPFQRTGGTWFRWPRGAHSEKPNAFYDLVEAVSPGPYVELFARRARFGWDYWGNESLGTAELPEVA